MKLQLSTIETTQECKVLQLQKSMLFLHIFPNYRRNFEIEVSKMFPVNSVAEFFLKMVHRVATHCKLKKHGAKMRLDGYAEQNSPFFSSVPAK